MQVRRWRKTYYVQYWQELVSTESSKRSTSLLESDTQEDRILHECLVFVFVEWRVLITDAIQKVKQISLKLNICSVSIRRWSSTKYCSWASVLSKLGWSIRHLSTMICTRHSRTSRVLISVLLNWRDVRICSYGLVVGGIRSHHQDWRNSKNIWYKDHVVLVFKAVDCIRKVRDTLNCIVDNTEFISKIGTCELICDDENRDERGRESTLTSLVRSWSRLFSITAARYTCFTSRPSFVITTWYRAVDIKISYLVATRRYHLWEKLLCQNY